MARPNTQIKFSRDIEKREKERKEREKEREEREERVKEREGKIEAISHKVSTERAALMDLDPPQKGLKRAMPFLPDPPSFDLTVTPNQWHT